MTELQIMPGAEPFYAEGGRVGVLVLHGFTGSPNSVRHMALGLAAQGYTVALPRLTGHGTTPADMAVATAADWAGDVVRALNWLSERCDKLFVAGLSMGGALTLWAAGQFPDRLSGIIPINAAVAMGSPDFASLAFNPDAPAELPKKAGRSDIADLSLDDVGYKVNPVPAIKHLYTIGAVASEMLPRIKCPALIITSRQDHVVPPANAEVIYSRINSADKEILWLEKSFHVATLDYDKELILERSLAFIQAHS